MAPQVTNGFELSELHDVQLTSPATGDLLYYADSTYHLWKNGSAASLGLATQSYVTSQGYITSSALSPYLLSSTASTTYAVQAPNDGNYYLQRNGSWEQVTIY